MHDLLEALWSSLQDSKIEENLASISSFRLSSLLTFLHVTSSSWKSDQKTSSFLEVLPTFHEKSEELRA